MSPFFWLAKDVTWSEEEYTRAIEHDPNAIQFVDNPTSEMISLAIKGNPFVIQHLDQTEAHCLEAVSLNGSVLRFVRCKTPAICEAAIRADPRAIQYVPDHPEYAQLYRLAVSLMPSCIQLIASPTPGLLSHAYDLPLDYIS